MISIQGKLFDGKSSNAVDGRLVLTDDKALRFEQAGENTVVQQNDLTFSPRLGQTARYIEIKGKGRFETDDNAAVDEFERSLKGDSRSSFIHRLESNLGLIVVGVFVTIAFVWALMKYGVPTFSDYIVDNLPDKTTDYIQTKLISEVESKWFEPTTLSESRQAELQALFLEVKASLGVNDNYVFKLYDASESVGANALAFPSGMIVMTDQLVELVDNDEQLAGIMAHEIGHLDGKHSLRQLVRGSIITFVVAWISGDVAGASSLVITAPTLLLQLKYSREFEAEADEYALSYIDCDKQKLTAMSNFFLILDKEMNKSLSDTDSESNSNKDLTQDKNKRSKVADIWSSHPATHKRSNLFRHYYANNCQ